MTLQELLIGWALTHWVCDLLDSSMQRTNLIELCTSSQLCIHPQPQRSPQWLSFWCRSIPIVQHFLAAVPQFFASAFDV